MSVSDVKTDVKKEGEKKHREIVIAGTRVLPGERTTIDLVAGQLYTHEPVHMPVHVVRGRKDGPVIFLSAAIHGDELNGIEIIRRILSLPRLKSLRGTLIAVPIVNVLGVVHQSRYLPDRRDLNRCFPGSEQGSLASRMAHLFMDEVVSQADYGLDFHTGAIHRSNLPQIRARLDDPEVMRLAMAFGASVALDSNLRDGSLREAASEYGIHMLLFEGGEALRFDELAIRVGVRGVLNVLNELGMLKQRKGSKAAAKPFIARASSWVRAPSSGIFRANVTLGEQVSKGQVMGTVSDPFGSKDEQVTASCSGIVIGRTNLPLVHEGEALYHIGRFDRPAATAAAVAARADLLTGDDQLFPDEDTIV